MIPSKSKNKGGFALILVLAFVVLVLTVALAFFSNSVLQRQISTSSANEGKVDLFAQGALDTTIGDLKQEIFAGSTTPTGTTGVYWPNAPANMVPTRVGTLNSLANLVKTSASGQSFYTGGPAGRASSLSTSASSSHPISAARWNAPILLPMPAGHSNTDLTPISDFIPPNWIYVDRSGNNPQGGTTDTVGRYAYCIYDEGGLLDMNVAGYPAEMDPSQAAYKVGSSFADLTQLYPPATPGLALTTAQIDTLLGWRNYASAQPSGSFPSYTFNPATSGLNYFNSVLSNPWGFMAASSGMSAINPSTLSQGQTDQKFVSRQQLITFLTQAPLNASPDVLQYMGTFSRALDQPSFRPDPNRPMVVANAGSPTTTTKFSAPAAGGNDAQGLDNVVNPFFLGVTVTSSFTRNDGITQAIVGEPLVKKRFALNRLAWVTYKGPSADNMTDPGVLQTVVGLGGKAVATDPIYQFVALGTALNIQNYFGLTWENGYWVYNHGIAGNNIGKLSDVQAAGREADFFELLKAALTVGALGKASGSEAGILNDVTTFTANDIGQYNSDTTTAYQVLQIGANMIDQFDADSYPTHILYTTIGPAGSVSHDIYGSENLPYLYRLRTVGVNYASAPSWGAMLLLPEVWNPYGNVTTGTLVPTNFRLLTTGGSSRVIAYTSTWNSDGNPSANPPVPNSIVNVTYVAPLSSTGPAVTLDTPPTPGQTQSWTPAGLTELDFHVPVGSSAAHEPFFVGGEENDSQYSSFSPMQAGINNSINKLGHGANVDGNGYLQEGLTASTTNMRYLGVVLGTFQNQWVNTTAGALLGYTLPLPYLQANAEPQDSLKVEWNPENPSSANTCFTINPVGTSTSAANNSAEFVLQYQDASGNWVIYDDKLGELPGNAQMSVAKQTVVTTVAPLLQDITVPLGTSSRSLQTGQWMTWMDPRTSRFGTPGNSYVGIGTSDEETYITKYGYYGLSDRPNTLFGCGCNLFTPGTGLPASTYSSVSAVSANSIGWYGFSGGWDYGNATTESAFVPGFYADNVTLRRVADNSAIISNYTGPNYFADPDGVVRRGMGGYGGPTESPTNSSTIGLPLAALSNSGTQSISRPYILNRPFRSVAELGHVFSGTPWRNLDMSSPESGATALLDVFCISDTPDPNALVAGKVNLNTRQAPVLQALLSGSAAGAGSAYKDEANPGVAGTTTELSSTEIAAIAKTLVARTTSTSAGQGPLENIAELVGKYNATVTTTGPSPYNIDGTKSYVGFTSDLVNNSNSLDQVFTDPSTLYIQRLRDSAIRGLSAGGQTRVWNLMIDLVAQTGKYRANDTSLDNFLVDGERRYWLHVAIDRFTGRVIDEQLEQVNE